MKKVIIIFATVLVLLTNCFAKDYMLPYKGGSRYLCTQGNDGTYSHNGNWEYSWDWAVPSGVPVLATAAGTVVFAGVGRNSEGKDVLGNTVVIDFGGGEYGKFCHFLTMTVAVGDRVIQGQEIGTCGSTGSSSTGEHIHYNLQSGAGIWDSSIASTFIDAEETDRIPKEGRYYISMNTYNPYNDFRVGKFTDGWRIEPFDVSTDEYLFSRPFVITYHYHGDYTDDGLNNLGHPDNAVHQGDEFEFSGYFPSLGVDLPWIQDITNTCGGEPWLTLVLNPFVENKRMGHPGQTIYGVVYPIHGQIRDFWRAHYSNYGYPACNEYWQSEAERYVVQWFELSPGVYSKIVYDTTDGSFNDTATTNFTYNYVEDGETKSRLEVSTLENIGCIDDSCVGGGIEPTTYVYDNTSIGIGIEPGDEAWSWRIVNEQTEFLDSDRVSVVLKLLDLKADFSLRYSLYRDGEGVLDFSTDTLVVDSEWAYSYIPVFNNEAFLAGDYSLRIYINSQGEESLLDILHFQVLKSHPDYIYEAEESVICESADNDTESERMVAINPKSVFTDQEMATFLIGIKEAFVSHRFKVVVSRNGEYYWEYAETNWRIVDPTWGWRYSYFNPVQAAGALPGEYRFDVYLDTGNGFFLLDTGEFSVIRTAPDYVFVGAEMCKDYQAGFIDWSWEPKEPTNVFKKDVEAAKCLVTLENVYVDVRFKNDVYYLENGEWKLFWSSGATGWYGIEDKWGFVYYMPSQSAQVPARDYQFRLSMDSGAGFQPLINKGFTVTE